MLKEVTYKNEKGQEIGVIKVSKSQRYEVFADGKKKSFPIFKEAEISILGESREFHSMEFVVSNK